MTVSRRQYATGGTITSTANITSGTSNALTSPAVAGNLLVFAMTVDKSAGGINLPSGWTVIDNQSGVQSSLLVCYKIAAGGETTATATWTTPQKGWTALLAEYQSDVGFANPPVGPSTSPAYVDVAGTSISLGPLTATAAGLPVVIGSIDSITGTGTTSTAFQLTATGWTWVGSGTRATSDAGGITSPTGAPGCSLLERNTQATSGEVIPATTVSWPWSDETVFTEFLIAEAVPAPPAVTVATAGTATVGESASATAVTCAVPAGVVAGEVLVATVTHSDTVAVPDQAGWTVAGKASGVACSTATFYRRATSSEPASYTFNGLTSGRVSAEMVRVTNVHSTTPLDVAAVTATAAAGTSLTMPSLTTVTAGALVIDGISRQTATSGSIDGPSGVTKLVETAGSGRRTAMFSEPRPTAGATGTRTFTGSDATAQDMAGVAVAFRPTSGGSDTTAPTVPTGVTATANSSTQVTVAWTASTDATGVASYRVRQGGVDVPGATAVGDTSAVVTGLSPSTAYSFTVSAVDAAGNRSAESTAATVTTPAAGTMPTLVSTVVGVPGSTLLRVGARTTVATSVRLQASTSASFASGIVSGPAVTPDAQGASQLTVGGLTAGSAYYYRVGMTVGGVETFSAASSKAVKLAPVGQANFAFDFASCCNAADSVAMSAIAARNDDLFFHLGDLFYADGSGTGVQNMRDKMNAKISVTNHAALFTGTPTSYTPSDHDGMVNGSNAGNDPTAWTNWNQAYRELWPTPALPATGAYYTFAWGRVRFIQIDGRSFKTTTTALGATQKQWLKDTITAATEPVIVIVNADSSWIGTGDTDAWSGYTSERTELASFFAASGKKIAMTAGDAHMLAADDGSHAPGGIVVWQAAPISNTSSIKGGPYSAGTYPTTSGVSVQQYGRVAVTDSGSSISLAFTGYSADGTARITQTTVVPVTAPTTTGRVVEQWNGTALVPRVVDRWNGTAIIRETVTT